jgi:monovalent cation:H+ antiporter-2, CPA2 family
MTLPSSISIVTDFAIIMIIAALVVYIFYRLKQPMIIGYLIAGVIIGPYTPPFSLIANPAVFSATADLGVILLLFGIGLRFPLSRLKTVGKVSVGVAVIEIAFMIGLSFGVSSLLGWNLIDALFLGTALASSSTVIIAKVLTDMGKLHETPALIMLGVLVVEDLIVVGLLAVITSTFVNGSVNFNDILWVILKILGFIIGSLIMGILIVPRIINRMVKLGNREVLLLIVLGLAFGLSIAGNLLGFSMAIGAFLMGVIVASSKSVDEVSSLISPVKDMFAAIFFVSIGALINITQFQTFIFPALLITILMIFGKMVGCGAGTRLFGYDNSTAIKVGLGMSQIGEFAFIVMKAGQDLNLISPFLFSTIGVSVAITTFLTPYLIKLSYKYNFNKKKPGQTHSYLT